MWCDVIKNWVLTVSMANKKKKKKEALKICIVTRCDLWNLGAHVTVVDSSDCLVRVYWIERQFLVFIVDEPVTRLGKANF